MTFDELMDLPSWLRAVFCTDRKWGVMTRRRAGELVMVRVTGEKTSRRIDAARLRRHRSGVLVEQMDGGRAFRSAAAKRGWHSRRRNSA